MIRHGVLLGLILMGGAMPARGQQKAEPKAGPRVVVSIPLGLTAGVKQKVVLRGLELAEAKEARLEGLRAPLKILRKGQAAVPARQEPGQVGNTEVEVEIDLPADFAPGEASLVVVTPKGETAPHRMPVDRAPLVAEKEPNPGFRQAQEVGLPSQVAGLVSQPQDVDVFRFVGRRGERVVIEVEAAVLGSPLDAILILTDERGALLKTSDDAGSGADPRIALTLPADGRYCVTLLDAHDQGGPAHVYRLSVRKEK